MAPTDWEPSYPGWEIQKEPGFLSVKKWLDEKNQKDGAENLWRIHNGLYNLHAWTNSHPGGSSWIELTKGTDITEAFEVHHLTGTAEEMLKKFFVRNATKPRNSPFTFKPDGFYRKLKEKVKKKLQSKDKNLGNKSKLISDTMAISTILFSILAAYTQSFFLAFIASFFLSVTVVTAHNFFHQRDNWRMYYFNLSLMSVRDWRISHALSHHIYPNSSYDLEVLGFSPMFQWLPKSSKSLVTRYISWFYAPIIYCFIFYEQGVTRLMSQPDGFKELIPLIIPMSMMIFGDSNIGQTILIWNFILIMASFIFGCIGLNAAHHHPDIFHDGDKPREDRDWGLYQMDTVRDRIEIKGVLPLVLSLFGDHTLHHLFPSIDHSYLNDLYPLLEETCLEFGYNFKLMTVTDLIKGQFLQLARNKPN